MKMRWLTIVMAVALACSAPPALGGTYIGPGLDFFSTKSATFFGTPMVGAPLGTYDFGSGIRNVGNTDTIVRRETSIDDSGPQANMTLSEILVMHLVTTANVDFGLGSGLYYLTLQSERGAMLESVGGSNFSQSPGGGTYNELFNLKYDLRKGSPTGPIAVSNSISFGHPDTAWTRVAPPGALLFNGRNNLLNGTDNALDFWSAPISGSASDVISFSLSQTPALGVAVPLPTSAWFAAPLLTAMALVRRRGTDPKRDPKKMTFVNCQ